MTYKEKMEAAFDVWFEAHRRASFERGATAEDRFEDHPAWSMGLRSTYREAWMGAVTWCALCQRSHEGNCIPSTAKIGGDSK